ncbi:hypothetical protein CCMA1212_009082 [Trichoderma ghanense]|uniref:Uncharacterized protein n=1 Tax=Trichoderma ghanense TaxID=65468 RepID=A0ABY2GTC5_9HYPO
MACTTSAAKMADQTIRTLAVFRAPGYPYQDDKLTAGQTGVWSDIIDTWMTEEINAEYRDDDGNMHPLPRPRKRGCDGKPRTKLKQFFNGRITPYNVGQKPTPITWIGFPRLIQKETNTDQERWKEADAHRDRQDEYLEWTVKRDEDGRILSVTFTCEGPEYWAFLAEYAPKKMFAMYQSCNPEFASQMKQEDLFDSNGKYEPYNKWNGVVRSDPKSADNLITTNPGCIMHLAQKNNTLSAEIDIAAQGTVIRKRDDGTIISDPVELCNCSAYGNPTRNSDPKIGSMINSLVVKGAKVSIADPVAIYMREFAASKFMLDVDGTGENLQPVPAGTFTWVRGDIKKYMGLRLHIQVPDGVVGTDGNEGRQLTVSDLVDTSNSQNVLYGAQFADYITMSVNGVVIPGGEPEPAQECPCKCKTEANGDAETVSMMASSAGMERFEGRMRV